MCAIVPHEILAQVVQWMATDDDTCLSNMALASAACADLVRTARFTNVCLQYDPQSLKLVVMLVIETLRGGDAGLGRSAIGPRIRNLRVSMAQLPGTPYRSKLGLPWLRRLESALAVQPAAGRQPGDEEGNAQLLCWLLQVLRDDRKSFWLDPKEKCVYLSNVMAAIQLAMPNLAVLQWRKDARMDQRLWPQLTECFYRLDELRLQVPTEDLLKMHIVPGRLRLRGLDLDCRNNRVQDPSNPSPFDEEMAAVRSHIDKVIPAVLRACAPHLRTVSINLRMPWRDTDLKFRETNFDTDLPFLEELRISFLDAAREVFMPLVNSPIRRLHVGTGCSRFKSFPLRQGISNLDQLETLILADMTIENAGWEPDVVEFLQHHKNIKHLRIGSCDSGALDNHIIPALTSGMFSSLTCLVLTWLFPESEEHHLAGEVISVPVQIAHPSLTAIARLESLRYLKLTARSKTGFVGEVINHDVMRRRLRGLQRLEFLAMKGDISHDKLGGATHSLWTRWFEIEEGRGMVGAWRDMSDLRARPELDDDDFKGHNSAYRGVWKVDEDTTSWEPDRRVGPVRDRYCSTPTAAPHSKDYFRKILVRNRALAEAEAYAAVFPSLQVVYVGNTLAKIVVPGSGQHGNAVPAYRRTMGQGLLEDLSDLANAGRLCRDVALNDTVRSSATKLCGHAHREIPG